MISQTWKFVLPIALASTTVSAACSGESWDVIVVGEQQASLVASLSTKHVQVPGPRE
jgi:hypothetical protein